MKMLHCQDCLAHYSDDIVHVCPPWMKALVMRQRLEPGQVVRFNEDGSETLINPDPSENLQQMQTE